MSIKLPKDVLEEMPELMQDAIDSVNQLSNIPEAMAVPGVLAVANFAAQGLANVDYIAWSAGPINEYFIVLNESGSMKSTMFSLLKNGVERFEKNEEDRYRIEYETYKRDKSIYDQSLRKAKEDDDLLELPVKPRGATYTMDTFTLNGLINALSTVPFVGMFNADAANFFNSYAFQDKKSGKDTELISVLSKLFSGEKVARQTGVEETNVTLRNRRFSCFLLLQRNLAGFLTNENYIEQGVTNRFLITQSEMFKPPRVTIGDAGKAHNANQKDRLKPFHERIYEMLDRVDSVRLEQLSQDDEGATPLERARNRLKRAEASADQNPLELVLPTLHFNYEDGAAQHIVDFINEFGADRPETEENGNTKNFYARCAEHACRLAATMTLFDDPYAKEIPIRYARCATGLVRWFIEQRRDISIDVDVPKSKTVEIAEELHKWMCSSKRKGKTNFTVRELQQLGPYSFRRKLDGDQRTKVIGELVSRDLIELQEGAVILK